MSSKPMTVRPIETSIFTLNEDLAEFIAREVPSDCVRDGMILAVTSKIMSLAEGRVENRDSIEKQALVEREADTYLGEIGHGCFLTIKHGLMIPSAGIDESNSPSGDYILYPSDPWQSCERLWSSLKARWSLKNLGILLTDSRTMPLRRGTTGVALAYWGFRAVRNMVGTPDLFDRPLKVTQMNVADGLAAAAVLMMGEAREARPLAVIENAEVVFSATTTPNEIQIPVREDLYFPVLSRL